MKKLFSIILVLAMVLAIGSGCTITVASRKSKIVGTYKLTTLSDYNGNIVERRGVEAYLVVPKEGNGYYVYKDNSSEVTVRYASIIIHPDEEKPNRYSYVEYKVDGESESVKCGFSGGSLNYSVLGAVPNKWPLETYWKTTSWTRESSAQDLSYVEDKLGDLPPVIPYGKVSYDGFYSYSNYTADTQETEFYQEFETSFVYAYLDLDMARSVANVHYMLKSDLNSRYVQYPMQLTDSAVTIGEQTFEFNASSSPVIKIPAQFTAESGTVYDFTFEFSRYDRRYFNLESNIQNAVDQYNESLGENE